MADLSSLTAEQAAVRDVLFRINGAWMNKRGDAISHALERCFADDIVTRGPGFVLAGKGRESAIRSYEDFVASAEIKNVSLDQPEVDVIDDVAVAQYRWKMTYVLQDQEYTEEGRDLFVLSATAGQWRVVWRALLTDPS